MFFGIENIRCVPNSCIASCQNACIHAYFTHTHSPPISLWPLQYYETSQHRPHRVCSVCMHVTNEEKSHTHDSVVDRTIVYAIMYSFDGASEPFLWTYVNDDWYTVDDRTVRYFENHESWIDQTSLRTMSTYERYHGERLVPMNTCITHIPLPTCSIIFSLRKHSCPLSPVACSVTRNVLKQKAGIHAPAPNHSKGILSVQERRVYACAFALNDTCRATDEWDREENGWVRNVS